MSLLMDTQTNRFWASVDFLATGEIVLHIPEECELPIRVLVSRGGRSTEYEPSSSEKPNNCEECKHWSDTEDGCADRHGCRATTEDCSMVEPQTDCGDFAGRLAYERGVKHAWEVAQKVFDSTVTFYEAEDLAKQIDKDINVRSKDEPQYEMGMGTLKCVNCSEYGSFKCTKCDGEMYFKRLEPKDEPQTEDSQDWKDKMWSEAVVTEPQTETEMERLERIDNEIEYAWARIRELTDEPQTE